MCKCTVMYKHSVYDRNTTKLVWCSMDSESLLTVTRRTALLSPEPTVLRRKPILLFKVVLTVLLSCIYLTAPLSYYVSEITCIYYNWATLAKYGYFSFIHAVRLFFIFFGRPLPTVAPLSQHVVCLSVCLSSVCDVLYSGETAGPICMKFSGKVWSDHGTTWLHFGSIRVNRAMPITRKRLDRFVWMHQSFCIDFLLWDSTVGHPSDSWASCLNNYVSIHIDRRQLRLLKLHGKL